MGGGTIIIIRRALKTALTDPLVSGSLPAHHKQEIDPFIDTDESAWTSEQQKAAFKAFEWAEKHC